MIGYLVRTTIGDAGYSWFEYLLHNPTLGFRWLVEYHGHWVMTRTASGVPDATSGGVSYQGVDYRRRLYPSLKVLMNANQTDDK